MLKDRMSGLFRADYEGLFRVDDGLSRRNGPSGHQEPLNPIKDKKALFRNHHHQGRGSGVLFKPADCSGLMDHVGSRLLF